mmetsp:Transcript_1234/g.2005  ORF Transcript_1234/g.2005 Transcript_1234/m.2005 type:complete len:109 (-) Transcript_1234:1536-1862(-)
MYQKNNHCFPHLQHVYNVLNSGMATCKRYHCHFKVVSEVQMQFLLMDVAWNSKSNGKFQMVGGGRKRKNHEYIHTQFITMNCLNLYEPNEKKLSSNSIELIQLNRDCY